MRNRSHYFNDGCGNPKHNDTAHMPHPKSEKKCNECQHDQPDTYGHSQACLKYVDSMEILKEMSTPTEKEGEWALTKDEINSIHSWIRNKYGSADKCVDNKCKKKCKWYDWCLITGKKYERSIDNYIQMCRSCHRRYDLTLEKKKQAIDNLWWKTGTKQNHAQGEKVFASKLTAKQVQEIRKDYKHNKTELARKYGITGRAINQIISRENWKHI